MMKLCFSVLRNTYAVRTVNSKCTTKFSTVSKDTDKVESLTVDHEKELDKLFKTIIVEVRSHDRAVLNSYEWFTKTAANELNVTINKISEPKKHHDMRTLLKSVHIHGKHRVQYDFRTYFRIFELKYLTGSTADTFLEYIQRNLPEGVAMKVTKYGIEKIPDYVLNFGDKRDLASNQTKEVK